MTTSIILVGANGEFADVRCGVDNLGDDTKRSRANPDHV